MDQILPADSIAEAGAQSPAWQSTLPLARIAVGLVVLCVLAEAAVVHVGIDDLDEGYFAQQTARVLHGQIPYRDFETLYSPGLVYVHALLVGLSGEWLLAPRALSLVARGALTLLLYAIGRPLVRNPLWAAAPGVVLLLGLDGAPVRWEPHPGWPSTLFGVLAAWCLKHAASRRWLAASGLCAAGAYAFKQNTGILILAGAVVWTLKVSPRATGTVLAAFGVATAAWLVPLLIALNGDVSKLGVLVGEVNPGGLVAGPDPPLLIALACLAGAAWLLKQTRDQRVELHLISASALFLTELPRADAVHLAWSAPLLLVLGAAAVDRAGKLLLTVAALAASLALLTPTLADRLQYLGEPKAIVAGVQVPSQTAADLQGAIDEIQQHSSQHEPIFVYPTSPLLYVLADRTNPTRFDHLNPGAASPSQIDQIIEELERARVKLVVVDEFWQDAWGDPQANQAFEQWLNEKYTEVARHGPYRVLLARLRPAARSGRDASDLRATEP